MSLKVWLPLNGDLRNLGSSDLQFSIINNSTTTTNNDGKIGKCYSNNSKTSGGLISDKIIDLTQTQSMFCWFKFTDLTSNSNLGAGLVSQHRYPNCTGMGITIKYVSSTTGYLSVNTGTGSSRTYNQYCGTTLLQANTWYHGGYTYDGSNIKIYVNGVCELTQPFTGMSVPAEYVTCYCWSMGSSSGTDTHGNYKLNGYINDVRIYDHCLSALEVKELSYGLVCHYKFDQIRPINNLVRNSTYVVYNNYPSDCSASLTATGEIYQGCKVYRLSYTPNATRLENVQTSLWSHGVCGFNKTFTANTKYCFWILCKPISHADTVIGGTASNIGGWTGISMKPYRDGWYICGQYRNGSVTANKTDNIFTSFKTPSATAGTPITIDFCCPHLVEGYDYILDEWDYQGTAITEEPDSSGHGYKAIYTGTQETIEDTCRYSRCTKFGTNTSKAYVTLPSTAGFANTYTFSWWGKNTGNSGQMFWGFSNGNRLNVYIRPTYMWNTGDGDNNPFTGVTSITDGKWHYYAVTGDGTASKLYIDGEFKANAKTYKGITGTTIYFNGWDSSTNYCFLNSISDWRLYATPLSADDIMRLYKEAIAFSKNATGVGYEVVENGSRELLATRITATYGASDSYYTKLNSQGEIQFDGATQSCGSPYIMINPSGKKYYYDYTISVATGNQFYIGFERYDKDKTATSNQSCVYTLATKPSADIVKQRYRGTVNLSTDAGGRACRYIRLRVLNAWSGTDSASTKIATIHSLSLREITTSEGFDKLDVEKTGVFDIDTLQEYFDTTTQFEKTGMNNMREFIEK